MTANDHRTSALPTSMNQPKTMWYQLADVTPAYSQNAWFIFLYRPLRFKYMTRHDAAVQLLAPQTHDRTYGTPTITTPIDLINHISFTNRACSQPQLLLQYQLWYHPSSHSSHQPWLPLMSLMMMVVAVVLTSTACSVVDITAPNRPQHRLRQSRKD
jgi:hypothetical protein